MTIQALREFINRHNASVMALGAVCAELDQVASGRPLDPVLSSRITDVLTALGAGGFMEGVTAAEAAPVLAEIRHMVSLDVRLLYPESRTTGWTVTQPEVLQAIGDFARGHAVGLSKGAVPNLAGLAARFAAPNAAFLDIGVGVAGLAIQMAELWPTLKIVGIDPWQPSLALTRANVAKAGLGDRIELREQGGENVPDEKAFDLAWIPMPFMHERVIAPTCARTLRALRPGGWVVCAFINWEDKDPTTQAIWRLRNTMWGGPLVTHAQVQAMLREQGFTDVVSLPVPPGAPAGLVAGRRSL